MGALAPAMAMAPRVLAPVPGATGIATGSHIASSASTMRLITASATHPGMVRRNNEDALATFLPQDPALLRARGALFAVADGLGGHADGEVASRTAVDTLVAEYYSPRAPHQIESSLNQAVQSANLRVLSLTHEPVTGLRATQTTLTTLVLAGRQAYVAHVGDCRVYLLRDGTFIQLTGDHSEAAELLRLRLIAPEQIHTHPRRNVLTRTLGSTCLLRPDFQRLPLQAGDRFLVCSDGLWGEVDQGTLAAALAGEPAAACERLVALACDHGGGDNLSLHAVHVVEPGEPPEAPPPGRIARLLAGLRGG